MRSKSQNITEQEFLTSPVPNLYNLCNECLRTRDSSPRWLERETRRNPVHHSLARASIHCETKAEKQGRIGNNINGESEKADIFLLWCILEFSFSKYIVIVLLSHSHYYFHFAQPELLNFSPCDWCADMCGLCIGMYWRASFAFAFVFCPEGPFTSIKVRSATVDVPRVLTESRGYSCCIVRNSNTLLAMILNQHTSQCTTQANTCCAYHLSCRKPKKQMCAALLICWNQVISSEFCLQGMRKTEVWISLVIRVIRLESLGHLNISSYKWRCTIFWGDVQLSTTAALDEKLRSVCQATKTPVTATRYHWTFVWVQCQYISFEFMQYFSHTSSLSFTFQKTVCEVNVNELSAARTLMNCIVSEILAQQVYKLTCTRQTEWICLLSINTSFAAKLKDEGEETAVGSSNKLPKDIQYINVYNWTLNMDLVCQSPEALSHACEPIYMPAIE